MSIPGHVALQRAAAPWSQGHYWGQFDSPGDLVNVAGSAYQIGADLQAGDVAWVVSVGELFVCSVPTPGAAVWGSISVPAPTAPTNLFVDPTTGNDSNDGLTPAAPLATLQAAIDLVPLTITADVVIHLASGTYTAPQITPRVLEGGSLAIVGDGGGQVGDDGFSILLGSTAAIAGSGLSNITTAGGLGVDTFQGKTVEILTGAAAGNRRTIRNHTDTVITPVERFSAAVAPTDTFRIVESAVIVNIPSVDITANSFPAFARGVGPPTGDSEPEALELVADPSLLLANLQFRVTGIEIAASFRIANSRVLLAGIEFVGPAQLFQIDVDSRSTFQSGIDAGGFSSGVDLFEIPVTLGLAASKKDWLGWGTFTDASVSNPETRQMLRLVGFYVHVGIAASATSAFVVCEGRWNLFGGAIVRTDQGTRERTGFLHVQARGDCRLEPTTIGFLIRGDHQDQGGAAVCAVGGGYALIGPICDISIGPTAGTALLACLKAYNAGGSRGPLLPGRIDLGFEAGAVGILGGANLLLGACNGGQIHYNRTPTIGTPVPSVANIGVWITTPNAVPNATGTFLAGGVLLTSNPGDGTLVRRGPT